MSISTLSELKAAVADWANRSDLTSQIATAVTLCEARMSRDLKVRSLEQRATASLTAGDPYTLLPSDLRALRAVKLNTTPIAVLEYVTPNTMDVTYSSGTTGAPRVFTVVGGEIRWAPTPDSAYTAEIVYSVGITNLASDSDTNTILLRYPDAYLAGTLAEVFHLLEDAANAARWEARYGAAVANINQTEEMARHGGVMRIRNV